MKKRYKYTIGVWRAPEWFEISGEFRAPKKGEFYLSGAIPEVYKAPNDLTSEFHIMQRVDSPPDTVVVKGFTYRLVP